jgi:hypothetical protein
MALKKTVRQGKQKQKEQPIDAEIRRAAERIGYDPHARQLAAIRQAAAQATDHLSEAIGVIEEDVDTGSIAECINRAVLELWRIRWALGAVGGGIKVEAEVSS